MRHHKRVTAEERLLLAIFGNPTDSVEQTSACGRRWVGVARMKALRRWIDDVEAARVAASQDDASSVEDGGEHGAG